MTNLAGRIRSPRLSLLLLFIAVLAFVPGQNGSSGQGSFTFERVSVTTSEGQLSGESLAGGMSGDGRWVLMQSFAAELGGDPDAGESVWVIRDRTAGVTSDPIPNLPGQPVGEPYLNGSFSQAVLSADGLTIAVTDSLNEGDIEIRQSGGGAGPVLWGGQAITEGSNLSLSANGRKLAFSGFYAGSTPVTTGTDTDIFVVDLDSGDPPVVALVSTDGSGNSGDDSSHHPVLSGDGQWVAFVSNAENLDPLEIDENEMADLYLKNLTTGEMTRVAPVADDNSTRFDHYLLPALSYDGSVVAFTTEDDIDDADTNGVLDVYVYEASGFTCVSCALTNAPGNREAVLPSLSTDGSIVTYTLRQAGGGFEEVQRFDRTTSTGTLVAQTLSVYPAFVSGDGCQTAFSSYREDHVTDTNEVGDAFVATAAGCDEPEEEDEQPPVISCAAADGVWHLSNVTLACTATDSGSGLANPADASFDLTTAVAAGQEQSNALTNSRQVCDVAGNCATAQVGGNMIDRRAPTVTVTTPAASAVFTIGQVVAANYGCVDNGSGLTSCVGPVASGQPIDTATLGAKTFGVTGTDNVGNSVLVNVPYSVVATGPTIAGLIQQVNALPIQPAIRRALVAALNLAQQAIAQGRVARARAILQTFVLEVRLLMRLGVVPVATGNALISQAQAIAAGL